MPTPDPFEWTGPWEPSFLALHRSGELRRRVEAALAELVECRACPRDCGVNRAAGETGICRGARYARVASAFPHRGEEGCLRGAAGSGTIFFSLCNLHCVFCQNWDISQQPAGDETDAHGIARKMLALQDRGCHNINFVTPEHVVPQVIEAIAVAAEAGLNLPIVYNTSAYDSVASLRLLEGLVDIYMPDFKFWRRETARRLCKAGDYPVRAREAIAEMHRQVGLLRFGPDGLARRGLLVRHLVMPGQVDETEAILSWLAGEISPDTFVNLMGQYRAGHEVGTPDRNGAARYEEIDRRPRVAELAAARAAAERAGLWRLNPR